MLISSGQWPGADLSTYAHDQLTSLKLFFLFLFFLNTNAWAKSISSM